jgi:hypothetical protein
MIFTPDEIANGLERLGRAQDAKYLQQVLLQALLSVDQSDEKSSTARAEFGKRIFAAELVKALKFDASNDGPDATELIRGRQRERPEPVRRHLRRRLPNDL